MMRAIAIDTSHAAGSVVARDGTSVASRPLGPRGEHAQRIALALAEAAGDLGWRVADAELVVVVRGPGSFTGLRVGVAAAKAIAWASGARLVGVCGFEVVAWETARLTASARQPVEIAFDAGRGEVYAATATPAAGAVGWLVGPPRLVAADIWIASLPPRSLASGPAVAALLEKLAGAGHATAPPEAWFPTAAGAADRGLARAEAGSFDDPQTLVPHYLRPSYADERSSGS